MPRRFTLSECYQVLDVDPKTFRSWLQKAGIEPQVSKADPRVKYLAEEQVRFLAKEHERDFGVPVAVGQKSTLRETARLYPFSSGFIDSYNC